MSDGHALDLAFIEWTRTAPLADLIRARDDCAIEWKWRAILRAIEERQRADIASPDR